METQINVAKKDLEGVIVFTLTGELDETNADTTFKGIYDAVGDFSGKKVVFNLEGVKYLNSKSIGYIADLFSNLEENDGKMYISNCSDSVKDILELVGITTIVPTVETEEEALQEINL